MTEPIIDPNSECECGHIWAAHDETFSCTVEDCPCGYFELRIEDAEPPARPPE